MPPWLSSPSPRLVLATALVVAALAAGVHGRAVGLGFVGWDDDIYVTDNRQLAHGLTAATVRYAFTTTDAANWHPLTWLSYLADVQWAGVSAWAFHATNVALHGVNAALVFLLLWTGTAAFAPSLVVAVFFAVHPLHVESVAWISERKNVLSTACWLAGMLAYVRWTRRPSRRGYALMLGGIAAALLAKPMAVTAPFVLLLLDYWPLERLDRGWRRLIGEKLPLFAMVAGMSAVTVVVQRSGGAVGTAEAYPLAIRLENAVWAYGQYLAKAIWPSRLAAFYPHAQGGLTPQDLLPAMAALLVISAIVVLARHATRAPLVGWCWYLGTLVPVIGLVQVGSQSMADRYAYVPLIGIFIAVSFGAAQLIHRGVLRADLAAAVGLTFALAFGMRTWRQIPIWYDTVTLFTHTTRLEPRAWVAHYNLGNAYAKAGRFDEAIRRYRRTLEVVPSYARAYAGLGDALLGQQRPAEALPMLERAVQLNPSLADAYNNLGIARLSLGRRPEGVDAFRRAIALEPDFATAYVNLAMALRNQGDFAAALEAANRALEVDPRRGLAQLQRGLTLVALGRRDEARAAVAPLRAVAPELAAELDGALAAAPSAPANAGSARP